MSDSRSRGEGPRRRRGAARATEARGASAHAAEGATPAASGAHGLAPASGDDRAIATPAAAAADAAPNADVIRVRAYELYVARGGSPGSDVEDWLAAERALLGADRRG